MFRPLMFLNRWPRSVATLFALGDRRLRRASKVMRLSSVIPRYIRYSLSRVRSHCTQSTIVCGSCVRGRPWKQRDSEFWATSSKPRQQILVTAATSVSIGLKVRDPHEEEYIFRVADYLYLRRDRRLQYLIIFNVPQRRA